MIEDEAERINKAIMKRERALAKGNEVKAEEIKKLLEEQGFEFKEDKDSVIVKRKKKASI